MSNNFFFDILANCDFDKATFCNWKSSPKSNFEWTLGSGETTSGRNSGGLTGPTSDASGQGTMHNSDKTNLQFSGTTLSADKARNRLQYSNQFCQLHDRSLLLSLLPFQASSKTSLVSFYSYFAVVHFPH